MNKYREVRTLGKGSFGRAVLVEEKSTNKQYVMKIIQTSTMKPQERQEALQEAQILEKLDHPNIIAYKESFQDSRFLYIVMEYANGGDLYQWLKPYQKGQKLIPEELIWDYFIQITLALKHIHDRRILHRDLKTQNVFLTRMGDKVVCKLGDFGVSKILSSTMECARTAIGTPYYLSPELCSNQGYNNKSDVWALGCVLYEMCTLQHTFEAANMKMLIVKILEGNYKPIPAVYSKNLKQLVEVLLQKDPKKRPSVNSILKLDYLQQKLQLYSSSPKMQEEFAHTVFHGDGDVLTGFPQEKEIKQIIGGDLFKKDNQLSDPPKQQVNLLPPQPRQLTNVNVEQPLKYQKVQPSNIQQKRQQAQKPSQQKANTYLPSDDTLLNKISEIDQLLDNGCQANQKVAQNQNSNKISDYPGAPRPNPFTGEQQKPQRVQPVNQNNILAYAPPQAYQEKLQQQHQNLNQHQIEVAKKLAPMSDKDRARLQKEQYLREKHEKAQQQRMQNLQNIQKGQEKVHQKYEQINKEYEQKLRQQKEKMYRDEDDLRARKNALLQQKQEGQRAAEEARRKQEAINSNIALQAKERHEAERSELRRMMAQKRREAAGQELPVEVLVKEQAGRQIAHDNPTVAEAPAGGAEAADRQGTPSRPASTSAPVAEPLSNSSSFGDQPDVAFQQVFTQQQDWQQLLSSKNEADSLCYRMESLRAYLEKELGLDKFIRVYREIQQAADNDFDIQQSKMEGELGSGNMGWLNVIVQLIIVEKRFNECQ